MSADVFVADEQNAHDIDVARWAALARAVLDAQGVRQDIEVSLMFVDEPTIGGRIRFSSQERLEKMPRSSGQ